MVLTDQDHFFFAFIPRRLSDRFGSAQQPFQLSSRRIIDEGEHLIILFEHGHAARQHDLAVSDDP
jgi:hypothetical protein